MLKTGDCIVLDDSDQVHRGISNAHRTASMNSFADAHTPSESPEASSSESSTGGDWESGEFKSTEHVDWPKHRITSKTKLVINKSNTAKQSQQFKVKSSNIKIVSNNNNKESAKKLRWLTNMRNDPDFRETLVRSVNIQPRQSIDSLDMDYYSAICDNQLSVGSPCKSPSELISKNQAIRNKKLQQQQHNQLLLQKHQHQHYHQQQHQHHQQHQLLQLHQKQQHQQRHQQHSSNGGGADDCGVLVVAKPIESQSIGFKIVNNGIASKKHSCDSLCSNKCETTANNSVCNVHIDAIECDATKHNKQSSQQQPDSASAVAASAVVVAAAAAANAAAATAAAATMATTSSTHDVKSILKNANHSNKRKSSEQSFKYRFFHKHATTHTSTKATVTTAPATTEVTNVTGADTVDGCAIVSVVDV